LAIDRMNWQTAVERTVTALGYELVDCERSAGGLLRVFIDRAAATGFVTVDDCERVTRQLQHLLEVEGCAYARLEVSSPGVDRPLKRPADWERFAGEQIDLTLRVAFRGRRKYRGRLAAQGNGWRIVFNDGKADQALDFTLDEVREARLVPVLDFKGRGRDVRPSAADGHAPVEARQPAGPARGMTQGKNEQ
jgi:ribosome maturation factor RimP